MYSGEVCRGITPFKQKKKNPFQGSVETLFYLFYLRINLHNLFILLQLFRETLINSSAR